MYHNVPALFAPTGRRAHGGWVEISYYGENKKDVVEEAVLHHTIDAWLGGIW